MREDIGVRRQVKALPEGAFPWDRLFEAKKEAGLGPALKRSVDRDYHWKGFSLISRGSLTRIKFHMAAMW